MKRSDDLCTQLTEVVCHPRCDDTMRAEAIRVAYETGKAEGKLDGARFMGEKLMAALQSTTEKAR